MGVVTRSAEGALVVTRGETRAVPAFPVETVVDTTGAGDLFAAGFLAGLTENLELSDCARLGTLAAAEIIGHLGARPQANLRDFARQEGLLGEKPLAQKGYRIHAFPKSKLVIRNNPQPPSS